MLYPICWGLSEGSNTISSTSEIVFYGILDIADPVFLFGFIGYLSQFDDRQVNLPGFLHVDGTVPAQDSGSQSERSTITATGTTGTTGTQQCLALIKASFIFTFFHLRSTTVFVRLLPE